MMYRFTQCRRRQRRWRQASPYDRMIHVSLSLSTTPEPLSLFVFSFFNFRSLLHAWSGIRKIFHIFLNVEMRKLAWCEVCLAFFSYTTKSIIFEYYIIVQCMHIRTMPSSQLYASDNLKSITTNQQAHTTTTKNTLTA